MSQRHNIGSRIPVFLEFLRGKLFTLLEKYESKYVTKSQLLGES